MVVLAALAIFVVASLGGSFAHVHPASHDPSLDADRATTHDSRRASCFESVRGSGPDDPCALCSFQRVLSQSQHRAEIQTDPLIPKANLAVRADRATVCRPAYSSDPRGPPLV